MSTNINLRRREFIHDVDIHLDRLPKGAASYRNKARLSLIAISKDLARLNLLPSYLRSLKPETIFKLVEYWQRKYAKPHTMQNRLAFLRRILSRLDEPVTIPTNIELGIIVKTTALKSMPKNTLNPDRVNWPHFDILIQNTCVMQYLFGLKVTEALRLDAGAFHDKFLMIHHSISFNHKDRVIQIATQAQKEFIKKFLTDYKSIFPVPLKSYRPLMKLYRLALEATGIKQNNYFRNCYIQNRYENLLNEHSRADTLRIIKDEVGYSRLERVKGVIPCPESF